ncbi:uncharacterized protein IUM83_13048 [Phytophthora cinnamomi]|uniref:uncharacterized protein n=1 Tax=Phytophthora cinnamomi TaxID=4785 RepID=UPI003559A966|nr:hypothetical protein IUM83_13048 [Phytophthora cinnamomi]
MPKFAGTKDDDVADYLFSAKLYFESKNIKYGVDSPQQRPLSLLVANLKGPAAAWYSEYGSHEFEELLTSEFTTPDWQKHLRDQLLRLRQNNFTCLEDYGSAFRHIICKVEDMSYIDKVMYFQKGFRQEVKLRPFRNTTDAISFALMSRVEYASRFARHRQEVIERARKNLLDAQEAQKRFYDRRRAANPFKVGDLALLSTQDLNISHATAETTLRSRKFIPRFIGPYPILELQGNVAQLNLPANLKHISPRVNIDKLKVYNSNPHRFVGRVISRDFR